MKSNRLLMFVAIGLACHICQAQTRWCSITGTAKADTLLYPPIGRAARVTGTVISRITNLPSGPVVALETVSGPPLLATSVNGQMKSWTLRTEAKGTEPCQSLLVITFTLGNSESEKRSTTVIPGLYRMSLNANAIVLSDPAFSISTSHWNWLKKIFKKRTTETD